MVSPTSSARSTRGWRGNVELPVFPGERSAQTQALKAIGAFDAAVERLLAQLDAGQRETAAVTRTSDVMLASDRADVALETLIRFNAAAAKRTGERIQEVRRRTSRLSLALHALAGVLALLVVAALARASRTHVALVEARARLETERVELAERRASDLDQFATRVAHDLNNPLGAMSLSVAVIERRPDSPEHVRSAAKRLDEGIKRVQRIIGGLLDFARAAGEVEPTERAEVGEAIDGVIAGVAAEAQRAGVSIEKELVGVVEVACPAGPLLSVIGNLVGNAVKYTAESPPGARGVRIRVRAEAARVRIEVEDSGPGIRPELQARIFEPYVRGDPSTGSGLGLGLAAVKRVVDACGGRVGLDSSPGRGSVFWVELPRPQLPASSEQRALH